MDKIRKLHFENIKVIAEFLYSVALLVFGGASYYLFMIAMILESWFYAIVFVGLYITFFGNGLFKMYQLLLKHE